MSDTENRRPVVRLNRNRQFGLFDDLAPKSAPRDGGESPPHPSFIDPDPREILIGTQSLEAHLKAVGNRDAFVVRRVLRELDFTVFEQAYSVTGRSAYAPKAMTTTSADPVRTARPARSAERCRQSSLGDRRAIGGIVWLLWFYARTAARKDE